MLSALPKWAERRPNPREVELLELAFSAFAQSEDAVWPSYAYLASKLYQRSAADQIDPLLERFPVGLLWPDPGVNRQTYTRPEQEVAVTLFGLTFTGDASPMVALYVEILLWGIGRRMNYEPPAQGPADLVLPMHDLGDHLRTRGVVADASEIARACRIGATEPISVGLSATKANPEEGSFTLSWDLRRLDGMRTLDDYFRI